MYDCGMEVLPLFTSHYSIGDSILTLDESLEIKDNYPVSLIALAKKYSQVLRLVDNNLSGFIEGYKNSSKNKIEFQFGLKLCVCDDLTKKDEESFLTESNVIIWILNSNGYKDLLQIYNQAATDGFYYIPRTDWAALKQKMTNNLGLTIPFYSSFIAKNTFNYKHRAIPDFGALKPILQIEAHDLPFDNLLMQKTLSFGAQTQKTHSCYYFKNEDILQYTVFRCVNNRTSFDKPNLSHFSSNKFSFESFYGKL